ncbi:unnamed protein product [Cercopithifilaria johnstoni]|uniref:Uncharacterized protein n=1 Tax=Cercopithifilaria johnstoni TaxID=2874296 RepID=A0A8J2MBY9_9BILA|nr:unnamed protein product [Cercopithifilaria johnstoni]
MKNGAILRKHNTRYGGALDEMLGIRSKKGNVIQKVELSKQTQLVERPKTRHGRYGEAVTAAVTSESFPLSFKLRFTDKSDVTVERWQRECEEDGRSDDEKEIDDEEEEKSSSQSNDANGTGRKSREHIQKIETVNDKFENDAVAIAQKIACSPAVNTAKSDNRFQHSIGTSNQGQDSDQSIKTVRQKNQFSGAVKKTKARESQISEENLHGTFRIRSIYATSRNKQDSELKKPVEEHLRTTSVNESPSSGKEAYEKWFQEKVRQEREKRRKQKEKEEEVGKAGEERRKEAERNYEIWKQRSDETIRERRKNKREKAEALTREKMEEIRRKKEEATQMFQAWKNDRLQRLSKEQKQHIQNKENDELKKKREKEIRNSEAQKAFNAWYEENKIRNLEAQRKLLKSKKAEEMQSRNAKEYKEALAREAYDVWLQIKESERRFNESLQGRIMKFDEMFRRSHLVPWVPPSNIIPRQFVPTRTRRHQSVKRSIKSNQAYKKFPSVIHRSKSALR